MTGGLKHLAVSAVLMLSVSGAAGAQSLDEMKAQLQALQKRIEQLEAAQRQVPSVRPPTTHAAMPAAQTRPIPRTQGQAAAVPAPRPLQAAQQAPAEVARANETAAAEVKDANAHLTGKPGLSFKIPGTETVVRPYGSIKVNGITDLTTQDQNDTLSAQSIPLFNTPAQRTGGDTQVSARRSRIGVETWTPLDEDFGEFHTLVEMDFAGQNTSLTTQATSSSYTPRLRKAYADFGATNGGWGAFLFGQTDTLFSDKELLPFEWLSDWTFVATSGVRQGQVRYTYGLSKDISAAFGIEAPYSDVTTTSGASYPDSNGGGGFGWQRSPDFTGRLLFRPDWGVLALRGVVRPQINLNNEGASSAASQFNKSVTGFGVGATIVVKLLDDRLFLMASANAGNGLGRYLDTTSNGFGAVSNFGLPGINAANASLDAVSVYGGMIGARYFLTPTLRTNVALGGAHLGMPTYTAQYGGCVGAAAADGTCGSVNTSEWAGSINLVWSPFKMVDVGLEYQHVERMLHQSAIAGSGSTSGGVENRLQFTAIGRF